MELTGKNAELILSTKPYNFEQITKLTIDGLKLLFETPKVLLRFDNVKEIDDDTLSYFLNYKGYNAIILDGLDQITDNQAKVFGKINQSLSLNGVLNLSLNAANHLLNRQKGLITHYI